ncbi:NUDIX hydrolase [Bradyrhizobium sp. CCGUVB1N3]|uniref:NUDIX hydrolase n=1 Tax=Bradyrhizobium sp. CCGUVB1N3 TaxID=2949629 RepID=UPI0020B2FF8D|nr:NUDIX hydrolase [Bradyrhizobium sp. CCGUVB1N3]MCP3472527.1 NUDIX hydrolase [Bradyrhizobium sp. CCGUVB1N3]
MTKWRPQSIVRVVAIGLHWRAGRLLAAEVRDDSGRLKGVRPLGGGVNFGEPWRTALAREFNEELGIDIDVKGAPLVMENIYVHEGAAGHEVMFISEVEFLDNAFEDQDSIDFREDSGAPSVARWFDLAALDLDDGPKLYPTGLKDLLLGRKSCGPVECRVSSAGA